MSVKPLNILEVVSGGFGGGGSRQAYLLAKGLHQRGHRVVLACRRSHSEAYKKMAQEARELSLPLLDVPMEGEGDLRSAGALRSIIKAGDFHIVHTHKAAAHTLALLALLFSMPQRKPQLVVQRGVVFPLKKNPFSKLKYRLRVAKFVAVSQGVKEELLKGGIGEEKIEVIYNGVELELFDPQIDGTPVKKEWGIPPGAPVITIIGNLYPHKGHQYFLAAAARVSQKFPQSYYLIVGGGEPALAGELKLKAQALGIAERVIFTGSREDIPLILAATDISVNASLLEGLPGTVRESSAMAKPVVATQVGGNPEVVIHNQTGLLVPPRDEEALAAALISLLQNPARAKALGAAGRRLMEEKFSHQHRLDLTEKLYYQLVNAR